MSPIWLKLSDTTGKHNNVHVMEWEFHLHWTYNTGAIDGRTRCPGAAYCSRVCPTCRPTCLKSGTPTRLAGSDCDWCAVGYSGCYLLGLLLTVGCALLRDSNCVLYWDCVLYRVCVLSETPAAAALWGVWAILSSVSYSELTERLWAVVSGALKSRLPVAYYIGGCLVYWWARSFISLVSCAVYAL